MKGMRSLFFILLGGLGLLVLIVGLNGLFQAQAAAAARRTPTAVAKAKATRTPLPKAKGTPKPAKTPVDWERATLNQIKFGKARTILTQNAQIKIWSWLPDNRRLLLELVDTKAKDVGSTFRIVTLDTKTGEIVEYGRRDDENSAPEWIPQTSSIAYVYSNWQTKEGPQLRLGNANGQIQAVAEGYVAFSTQPSTGNVYYRVANTQPNSLQLINPNQNGVTPNIAFPSISLPPGSPLIDMKGQFMAIVGSPMWGMLNLSSSQFKTYLTVAQLENGMAVGTSSEMWSPNSKQIAFLFTQDAGIFTAQVPPLSIFDVSTGQVRSVKLPIPAVVEFDWSPQGRFILVKGANPKGADADGFPYPNTFWLVDAKDQTFKQLDYFPSVNDSTQSWMAWNSRGQLAWVKNVPQGLAIAVTKVSAGR